MKDAGTATERRAKRLALGLTVGELAGLLGVDSGTMVTSELGLTYLGGLTGPLAAFLNLEESSAYTSGHVKTTAASAAAKIRREARGDTKMIEEIIADAQQTAAGLVGADLVFFFAPVKPPTKKAERTQKDTRNVAVRRVIERRSGLMSKQQTAHVQVASQTVGVPAEWMPSAGAPSQAKPTRISDSSSLGSAA